MNPISRLVGRTATFRDLLAFLWRRKLWWMIPLVVLLLAVSLVLFLALQSPISPFIYTLF